MKKMTLLILMLFSSLSFALEECSEDSDCESWEECSYVLLEPKQCVPYEGRCNSDADCEYNQECNFASHDCVLEKGKCETDSDCEDWETCMVECILREGACYTDADCAEGEDCVIAEHNCKMKAGYCITDADCKEWQKCPTWAGRYGPEPCELGENRCNVDSDCIGNQECETASHDCRFKSGYCGGSGDCENWQICKNGRCEAKSGYCVTQADCTNQTACDPDAHTCLQNISGSGVEKTVPSASASCSTASIFLFAVFLIGVRSSAL